MLKICTEVKLVCSQSNYILKSTNTCNKNSTVIFCLLRCQLQTKTSKKTFKIAVPKHVISNLTNTCNFKFLITSYQGIFSYDLINFSCFFLYIFFQLKVNLKIIFYKLIFIIIFFISLTLQFVKHLFEFRLWRQQRKKIYWLLVRKEIKEPK